MKKLITILCLTASIFILWLCARTTSMIIFNVLYSAGDPVSKDIDFVFFVTSCVHMIINPLLLVLNQNQTLYYSGAVLSCLAWSTAITFLVPRYITRRTKPETSNKSSHRTR